MSSSSKGIIRSRRNCCVLLCSHTEAKNPEVNFYCFPREEHRRHSWVRAVNRIDDEGNPWYPTANSRVCSTHFKGGKKSDDKNSQSYIPTIFPAIYEQERQEKNTQDDRVPFSSPLPQVPNDISSSGTDESCSKHQKTATRFSDIENATQLNESKLELRQQSREFGCQTDPWFDQPALGIHILFCCNEDNNFSTQTEIYNPPLPDVKKEPLEKKEHPAL